MKVNGKFATNLIPTDVEISDTTLSQIHLYVSVHSNTIEVSMMFIDS